MHAATTDGDGTTDDKTSTISYKFKSEETTSRAEMRNELIKRAKKALHHALYEETVMEGFKSTGISPFNREAINQNPFMKDTPATVKKENGKSTRTHKTKSRDRIGNEVPNMSQRDGQDYSIARKFQRIQGLQIDARMRWLAADVHRIKPMKHTHLKSVVYRIVNRTEGACLR